MIRQLLSFLLKKMNGRSRSRRGVVSYEAVIKIGGARSVARTKILAVMMEKGDRAGTHMGHESWKILSWFGWGK